MEHNVTLLYKRCNNPSDSFTVEWDMDNPMRAHFYGSNISYNLYEISVHEGVTVIPASYFHSIPHLQKVTLPKSCKIIHEHAFYNCMDLKEINLENIERVESCAFYNTRITFADLSNCAYIGESSFSHSHQLEKVKLSKNIEFIGMDAFLDCNRLHINGKWKATKSDLTCQNFQYEIGK